MTELQRVENQLKEFNAQLESINESILAPKSAGEILALHKDFVTEWLPKVRKFEIRAKEKDPVTGNLKYGEKYRQRVLQLTDSVTCIENVLDSLATKYDLAGMVREEDERRQNDIRLKEALENQMREDARKKEEDDRIQQLEEQAKQKALEAERSQQRLDEAALKINNQAKTHEEMVYEQDKIVISKTKAESNEGIDAASYELQHALGENARAVGVVKHLKNLWEKIVAHPENAEIRTINAINPEFRSTVASVAGGREFLVGAGFKLEFRQEDDEINHRSVQHVTYTLTEPDLSVDMDKWENWFTLQKHALARLSDVLRS